MSQRALDVYTNSPKSQIRQGKLPKHPITVCQEDDCNKSQQSQMKERSYSCGSKLEGKHNVINDVLNLKKK